MKKVYRERQERKTFGLPIIIDLQDTGVKVPARLTNISEGGISFKASLLFKEGEKLKILIPDPAQLIDGKIGQTLELEIELIWLKEYKDLEEPIARFIYGARFVAEQHNDFLKNKILELMELSQKNGEKPLGF